MRLSLVAKLCRRRRYSISQLTEGSRLTRQAITKRLRVLERAGTFAVCTRVVRAYSNSIRSRLKKSGNTLMSFPSSGIGH